MSISLTADYVGDAAFSSIDSQLMSLSVSTLNSSIPTRCFSNSTSLKKIDVYGPNLSVIHDYAFENCTSLTSVEYG